MSKEYNTNNEVVKKNYEEYLALDGKLSDTTIYQKVKSIRVYEEFNVFKDFKTFNKNQALEFKDYYKGKDIEFSTIKRSLDNIKEFFIWLSRQAGYKKTINIDNVKAFNLSMREERMASTKTIKKFPTVEQVTKVIISMPSDTLKEKRDRAFIAFTLISGGRISALMTLKLKSVNEYQKFIEQDPNDGVETKRKKYIVTRFFPVGKEIEDICLDWVKLSKEELLTSNDDYLFNSMKSELAEDGTFKQENFSKEPIKSDSTVRDIFKKAFKNAGLQYYHPHSFRQTIVQLGYKKCKTPEEFKAWSQNLGHKSPLTTFTSYGQIDYNRQVSIIDEMWD